MLITGEPTLRTFTKKDGTTGTSLSLRVNEIELLGSKAENKAQTHESIPTTKVVAEQDLGDLPF